jgi:outer membrane lipoprotein SlyB
MKKLLLAATLGLVTVHASAQAPQPVLTPKAQLAADSKAAQARYEADKNLCNDEATSGARLQCRRDAKEEYDAAIAAAKARMAAVPQAPVAAPAAAQAACVGCGKVAAVAVKEEAGKGGATGLIAGGVGGALLGRQVGSGSGKDLATIAGAVGGAYAGKKIEEKMTTHKVWTVTVQYPNGSRSNFGFDHDPGFSVGDPVRNAGTSIARQ